MPKTEARDDVDVDAVLAAYGRWLGRQPLTARSREAYLAQVRGFVGWLAGSDLEEWISGGLVANRMVNRVLRPSAVDRENPAFAGFSVRRV